MSTKRHIDELFMANDPAVGILESVETALNRQAVLVGGYLRDKLHGKPFKDIDIFVASPREHGGFEKTLEGLREEFGNALSQYLVHMDYLGWDPEVTGVATIKMAVGEVQVIGLNWRHLDIQRVLNRFDFGLCQVGWSPRDGLVTTPAFEADRAQKTFTLLRYDTVSNFDRSMRRWERFSKRYSEHRLVTHFKRDELSSSLG